MILTWEQGYPYRRSLSAAQDAMAPETSSGGTGRTQREPPTGGGSTNGYVIFARYSLARRSKSQTESGIVIISEPMSHAIASQPLFPISG
jgi:hypothetical protein